MTETKAEWRERLLRARRAIDANTRREASATVVLRLAQLPAFLRARSVLLYVARAPELDVDALAAASARAGKDVYRPASISLPPRWTALDPTGRVRTGARSADGPTSPILLVAPGVGFDRLGGRLGRGGGYYDRAIAALRACADVIVVGAAYEAQVVDALPRDPWDEDVDVIVTERHVLVPQPSRRRGRSRRDGEEVRDDS